jgi:uncharacterized protein YwqG
VGEGEFAVRRPHRVAGGSRARHRITSAATAGGVDIQGAVEEHRDDYLLLQLVYEDLMEWLFGDVGAFQFWISADALRRREWSRATVTFESH